MKQRCKHCGKSQGEHHSRTMACPQGLKHRAVGCIQYSQTHVFENRVYKPLWITNHPAPLKGMWPRRAGAEYYEGLPKATSAYSVKELQARGIIGVYVSMLRSDYNRLQLVKNPHELATYLQQFTL